MAREFQRFAVTIASGTLASAPLVQNVTMPPRIVRKIEVIVPPGPRGEVGFQLGFSGKQLIPYTVGQFIVTDDEKKEWDLEGFPDSGAWQVIAYNTGSFNHTLEFIFHLDLVDTSVTEAPTPVSNSDLSSPPPPPAGSSVELPPPPPLILPAA